MLSDSQVRRTHHTTLVTMVVLYQCSLITARYSEMFAIAIGQVAVDIVVVDPHKHLEVCVVPNKGLVDCEKTSGYPSAEKLNCNEAMCPVIKRLCIGKHVGPEVPESEC